MRRKAKKVSPNGLWFLWDSAGDDLYAVTREADELFLVIEVDVEAREKPFLSQKAKRHVIPLVRVVNLDGPNRYVPFYRNERGMPVRQHAAANP